MSRQDYLITLEKALVGRVDPDQLRDTMEYYRDYFYMEGSKGKSEQEISDSLGDPRLLAKSIIAVQDTGNASREVYTEGFSEDTNERTMRRLRIPFPLVMLIIILIFFSIIALIFSIASALLPILLPALIVFGIISLFRKR